MQHSQGISVGGEDEFDLIPTVNPATNLAPREEAGHAKSVSIGGGQFFDDDEHNSGYFGGAAGASKDMGTDYDPPTRYELGADLPGMSEATLSLLEKEMGFKFTDVLTEVMAQPRNDA